jgi:hypothetical protein
MSIFLEFSVSSISPRRDKVICFDGLKLAEAHTTYSYQPILQVLHNCREPNYTAETLNLVLHKWDTCFPDFSLQAHILLESFLFIGWLFVLLSSCFFVLVPHFISNSFLNVLVVRIFLLELLLQFSLCWLPSGSGNFLGRLPIPAHCFLTSNVYFPVWWPGNKNIPTVTHACRKRRLKWVTTLPLGDINKEAWYSGMGVERGANNPTL